MDYTLILYLSFLSICNGYVYKTEYFETKVDHFSFTTDKTFKLRYLINDSYWEPDILRPIFLYTGNEGDITTFAENTGFMWEIAPEFKALVLFAEHRYYGESKPFGNLSLTDPKYSGYLTASQAMMDYIQLISYIKDKYNITSKSFPVVAFGGSYGGMLAAWIRMKYPSVITGSLASSAPIWQFTDMTDCSAFYRVTTSAYTSISKKCSDNIRKSWEAINNLAKTDDGKKRLSKIFNTCQPIQNDTQITQLKNYLNSMYVDIAMVNYPYPASFIGNLPANPVKAVCQNILSSNTKHKDDSLLNNVYNAVLMFINGTGTTKCFDMGGSVDNFGDSGWGVQSCNEMVMPMCSNGQTDMFEKSDWNFKTVSDECFKNYKLRPSKYIIRDLFGGKNIHWASNIIFSNGLLDPWSSGGVVYNLSDTAVSVMILESAHHLDLRAENKRDPPSVIVARNMYKNMIMKWIN